MIKIQKKKINISLLNKKLLKKGIGAVVNFTGIARPANNSGNIEHLEIEHYAGMTEKKIKEVEKYALKKWLLNTCIIIHRYGKIKPGKILFMLERQQNIVKMHSKHANIL